MNLCSSTKSKHINKTKAKVYKIMSGTKIKNGNTSS